MGHFWKKLRRALHYAAGRLRHFAARLKEFLYRHCRCRVRKAAVLVLLTRYVKQTKDRHPIVFILGSALVGALLSV